VNIYTNQPTINVSSQVKEQCSDQNKFHFQIRLIYTGNVPLKSVSPITLGVWGLTPLRCWYPGSESCSKHGYVLDILSRNKRRRSVFSVLSSYGGAIVTLLVSVNLPVF